jgi:hypothetical protein
LMPLAMMVWSVSLVSMKAASLQIDCDGENLPKRISSAECYW